MKLLGSLHLNEAVRRTTDCSDKQKFACYEEVVFTVSHSIFTTYEVIVGNDKQVIKYWSRCLTIQNKNNRFIYSIQYEAYSCVNGLI